jgi:hypothetical protein
MCCCFVILEPGPIGSYPVQQGMFRTYFHKVPLSTRSGLMSGDCFISKACNPEKETCSSVWDINVSVRDLNRVYCRNAYYSQEWGRGLGASWPNPCSNIKDDGTLQTFPL